MAEEPSLPDLPPYGSAKKTVFGRSSPRKHARFHHSSSVHFSSDPPLFSSDDDPGLDNYADPQRRHKRKYRVGPYSQAHPLTISENNEDHGPKRKLQRIVDSGVFLASDGTEDDTDIEFLKRSKPVASHITLAARPARSLPTKEPSVDDKVRRDIEDCLENGKEDIDLSARNIETLSNAAIKPLASFSPLAVRMQRGGSQHGAEPKLRIWLARNRLQIVPTEIFNLEHLSVLSLRNNEIRELPEVIRRLTGLKELNIAYNALQWLPYELLQLLSHAPQLKTLGLHPNPFIAPMKLPLSGLEGRSRFQLGTNWEAQCYRRSHVRFMGPGGRLLKGPAFSSQEATSQRDPGYSQLSLSDADADDVPQPPSGQSSTYVPSLEEMCIKAWAKTPESTPGKYDSIMPTQRLTALLDTAKATHQLEGRLRRCTVCSKEYVTARTEWIEWWAIYSPVEGEPDLSGREGIFERFSEATVPLIRRGCSWRCLPS